MITGNVKWFDNAKGFGFISREGGDDALGTNGNETVTT